MGEHQSYIQANASKDPFFDGRQAFLRSGDLDKKVGLRRARKQILGRGECRACVVREQRRHIERYPTIHAAAPSELAAADVHLP